MAQFGLAKGDADAAFNSNQGLYKFLCAKRAAKTEQEVQAKERAVQSASDQHRDSMEFLELLRQGANPTPQRVATMLKYLMEF